MRHYETTYILRPNLGESQFNEVIDRINGIISEFGGALVSLDRWGLKKLAYPIQKKSTGFYYLLEFRGTGDLVEKLEVQYRRDERIIRFLTFRMEKFAIEYAEKKRRQKESAKAKEE